MKLIKITSMMAVAVAAGFCMSVNATVPAGEGKNGNLELTAPATNVNVTTSAATGGSWNTSPGTEGAYFVIDCDAATSNQFNATRTTDKIVKCAFTLKPAPVPYTDSLPAPDASAQVAFCIATNTTSGGAATLNAYVSGGWTNLTGTIPSAEYTLTITFDYTGATKYAKFAIDGVDLTNGDEKWFQIAASATGVKDYCFIGSGDLKSILTTGQDVTAETIDVSGAGSVNVPEEVITSITVPDGSTLAAELAKTDAGGNKVIDNVVLGLRTSEGLKDDGKLVAKNNDVGSTDTTKIKLGLNAVAPEGTGATVTYQLRGSNDGSTFTDIGDPVTNPDSLEIPLTGTVYKYYNVKAVITYPNN